MSKLLAILLFPLCALAQVGVEMPILNQASSGVPNPKTVPGLEYWWVSSDLTNNASVSNWVDRIQGLVLTQGASSIYPTNNPSLGVTFSGTQYLTNANIICSNFTSFVLIYTYFSIPAVNDQEVLDNIANAGRYRVDSTLNFELGANELYKPIVNVTSDMAITAVDLNFASCEVFTNNVLISTTTKLSAGTEVGALGGANGSGHAKMRVLEFLWYTNNVVTNLSWMATIHKYATNTYSGISP